MLKTLRAGMGSLLRRLSRRDATYYPSAYRKADLERDYWSIVGPASAEEFRALGQGKRELLVERGLRPTSRLLDVGCGTGQLTAALADYLAPEGAYVGTDIAAEAVEFCRRRFTRPNFRFVQSAMTRVPIDGEVFDWIYLGSVFTHMYPAEITALLADFVRLLDPRGAVVADAFFAPGLGTWRGDRGMVVVDEELLGRSFHAAGYVRETIRAWPVEPRVERGIFELRRAQLAEPSSSAAAGAERAVPGTSIGTRRR